MPQGAFHGERRCFSPRSGFVQYAFTQVDGEKFMDGMKKIQVKHHHHQSGFSLVELAVVIFIIGLIASMSFGAFKAQMVNASIRATKTNQDSIKDALVAYLGKNRRLPCPAIDNLGGNGRDSAVIPPSNCKTYFGLVPYQELGLTKNIAMDGWDNFFTYGVSPQWTATLAPATTTQTATITNTAGSAFNVGNIGVIIVQDRIQTPSSTPPILPNAAAIILSHGANGMGAYTAKGTQNDFVNAGADEKLNVPTAAFSATAIAVPATLGPYFKREYSDNTSLTGGAFDDVVSIVTPNDLIIPLTKGGTLNSPEGQWATLSSNIQNWVVGQTVAGCNIPAALPVGYITGPWGETITYNQNSTISPLHFSGATLTYLNNPLYTLTDLSVSSSAINGPTAAWLLGTNPNLLTHCP
jgi:prepilin-type N-terminal cleavage/methylation domain-containing protein